MEMENRGDNCSCWRAYKEQRRKNQKDYWQFSCTPFLWWILLNFVAMTITKLRLKRPRKSKLFNARATAQVAELFLRSMSSSSSSSDFVPLKLVMLRKLRMLVSSRKKTVFKRAWLEGTKSRARSPQTSKNLSALRFINKGLNLRSVEINRLRRERTESLLQERKLILILDLDHTLLHTVDAADLSEEEVYFLDLAEDDPDRDTFRLDAVDAVTKLRPFVRDFLREASKMFDMYIYTMGRRDYALDIARLLDPQGVYFNSKVISRESSTVPKQKGLDIVLGEERIAVIVDDTECVWARDRKNLMPIERYQFFGSRNCDESELSGALATRLHLLGLVHQLFFDNPALAADFSGSDVRELLGLKKINDELSTSISGDFEVLCC